MVYGVIITALLAMGLAWARVYINLVYTKVRGNR
jgi:hypothetical protein